MCGCKKKEGGKKGGNIQRTKKRKNLFHRSEDRLIGHFGGLFARPVRKVRKPKERKHVIKMRRSNAGVYMKGNTTKRKTKFRQKIIGARRGRKRGAQWIDDDYLANMPTIGRKTKTQYAFLK